MGTLTSVEMLVSSSAHRKKETNEKKCYLCKQSVSKNLNQKTLEKISGTIPFTAIPYLGWILKYTIIQFGSQCINLWSIQTQSTG